MIRDVCYHGEPCTPEDRLFQIVAFRTFSKTATWQTVRDILSRYPVLDDLADGSFSNALDQTRLRNGGLYTGAFILCATDAYGQSTKHRNHAELLHAKGSSGRRERGANRRRTVRKHAPKRNAMLAARANAR
jgi:hypothetical protein